MTRAELDEPDGSARGRTTGSDQRPVRSPGGLPALPDHMYWGSAITSQSNVVSPTPAPRNPAEPVPQAPALWIETTAYGLLHLLLREGKAEMADQTAAWLTHQGSFQGGFRSTQVGAALGLRRRGGGVRRPGLSPGATPAGHGDRPGCAVGVLDHVPH